MATREENLKKINDELEKMSDEELENVAGGTYNETAADSRFLNDLAGLCDRYGASRAFFEDAKISREVTAAWGKLGINIDTSWGSSNRYFRNGNEITRNQAIKFACEKYSKNLQDMPGDYNL